MARGWGRSEEDLAADKEQERAKASGAGGRIASAEVVARRRAISLSLARIRDERSRTPPAHERRLAALDAAERDLEAELAKLPGGGETSS
jgi:hypothetical protein